MPTGSSSSPLLQEIREAFDGQPRPQHFTNHTHCCECAEHDQTLNAHDPDSISLDELASPAWDPMTFATVDAFLYYMPGLARLALGIGSESYLDQFLFHLRPERLCAFSAVQRRAVLRLLNHVADHLLDEFEIEDDLHLLCVRLAQLEALERMAQLPPLVRRLFYAVKHSLDDPYITRHEAQQPKSTLAHYPEVTSELLKEVGDRYRIERYNASRDDYEIELTDLVTGARYCATREEMLRLGAGGWESLGGYLYIDGLPLAGTPLDSGADDDGG